MSKAWESGTDASWKRVRPAVLKHNREFQRGQCQVRSSVCTGKATCVHHTQPRHLVGDDPKYLLASCAECNQHVGDPSRHDPDPQPRTKW